MSFYSERRVYIYVTEEAVQLPSKHCYGIERTYDTLKTNNVTVNNLFYWNAPIDVMVSYQKYLDSKIANGKYCACLDTIYFGPYREYTFDKAITFSEIIQKQFQPKASSYPTCHMACDDGHRCLDWREICNGIVDCLNGDDEGIQCVVSEFNECNLETEFRCKNGMCIPKDFAFGQMIDCLDTSDETNVFVHDYFASRLLDCSGQWSIECEEHYCRESKLFTCGDGTCILNPLDYTGKSCQNKRNIIQIESTFLESSLSLCHKCKLCATTNDLFFKYLKEQYNLTTKVCQHIASDCKSNCTFYFTFPSKPVMFPSVRFIYNGLEISAIYPEFLCYEQNICEDYIPTKIIHNFACHSTKEFNGLDFTTFGIFYKSVQRIFSICVLSKMRPLKKNFYQCNSTLRVISIHRVRDGVEDCYLGEDEFVIEPEITNSADYFKCLTLDTNEYIPRSRLFDGRSDCSDMSDEMMPFVCKEQNDLGCQHLRGLVTPYIYFLFDELCNGIVHSQLIFGNDTDETDCYEWRRSCRTKYVSCDRNWNCINGRDEVGVTPLAYCRSKEQIHYCRLPENGTQITLPIEQIGDQIIDCLGSTDERFNYCPLKYPFELTRRFHRWNTSECVHIYDVCDGIVHCPYKDDEIACPKRKLSNCPPGTFACGGITRRCLSKSERCNGRRDCRDIGDENDELFCDLVPQRVQYKPFLYTEHNQYPPPGIQDYRQLITGFNKRNSYLPVGSDFRPIRSVAVQNKLGSYCNRGIGVRSLKVKDGHRRVVCLCPPSHYGKACQFQNKRLTVLIQIIGTFNRHLIFRLLVRLFDETNLVLDSVDVLHMPYQNGTIKNVIYLVYPHNSFYNISLRYFVRIDIFSVSTQDVEFHSSRYFNVKFPFLPVDRLAVQLKLDNKCDEICLNGSHVIYIDTVHQDNKTSCSSTSLAFEGQCICPLGTFGNDCGVQIDLCKGVECLNNGTCVSLDIKQMYYTCICIENYFGDLCQYSNSRMIIGIKELHQDPLFIHIPVVLVYFVDIYKNSTVTLVQDRLLFKNVPFNTNLSIIYKKQSPLPALVFVQTLFNTHHVYGLYYIVSLLKTPVQFVSTNILVASFCPYVGELLSSEIMSYSYLKRVKYYHQACFTLGTKCFFDEYYMCLCDNEAYIDCFVFNHRVSNCTNQGYCQNGGHCYQPMSDVVDFACVCRKCYYGNLCQFTTSQYSISLDALLGSELTATESLYEQSHLIKITFTCVCVMFIFGLFSNVLSIVTFASCPKTREIGSGIYLLWLCIISQFGLIIVALKFYYLVFD
ncbi:unnamed protein product [Didymodactylos carnosus]|uniref:EGF-like domain-containing protein n=1 Tax=Didymodactylos carnosus TaxID=1234261 RepID=A0A814ZQQ8_9BILA|nr:unnamed protein product [Didymodactylos carnosus]CAF4010644.1 unnamed protein product [Didymodactylos carnosus]